MLAQECHMLVPMVGVAPVLPVLLVMATLVMACSGVPMRMVAAVMAAVPCLQKDFSQRTLQCSASSG